MSTKERIFHSLLFEVFALISLVFLGSIIGGIDTSTMTGVAIFMSLMAMSWNYVYNQLFDKWFGANRIDWGLGVRVLHSVGFEIGLLFATVPLLMWVLDMDFLSVLILDIGMVIFFLIFSTVYNWCYDHIRYRVISA